MSKQKRDLYNQMNNPPDGYNPWKESDKGYFLEKESSFPIFSVIVAGVAILGVAYGLYRAIQFLAN